MTDAPVSMEFDVVLRAGGPSGRNIMIELPEDPKPLFGSAKPPVVVHLDDHPPFRTTVAVMGGRTIFGLRQAQVAELGVAAGQTVHVRLVHDTAPRTVELPTELAAAFTGAADARAAFDALAPSHRKEYARWVGEAKKQETRDARAVAAVEKLRAGEKTPR